MEHSLEQIIEDLRLRLGREITPREKFYLALSQACAPKAEEEAEDFHRFENSNQYQPAA